MDIQYRNLEVNAECELMSGKPKLKTCVQLTEKGHSKRSSNVNFKASALICSLSANQLLTMLVFCHIIMFL